MKIQVKQRESNVFIARLAQNILEPKDCNSFLKAYHSFCCSSLAQENFVMPRYSSLLMEHFQSPHNAGALEVYDGVGEASLNDRAPRMRLYLALEKGLVSQAGFETFGCGVSIACGSALTEMALGHAPQDCLAITETELVDALGGVPSEKRFCANLAIRALQAAVKNCAEVKQT